MTPGLLFANAIRSITTANNTKCSNRYSVDKNTNNKNNQSVNTGNEDQLTNIMLITMIKLEAIITPQIQATGDLINCGNSHLGGFAMYCPSRHNIKEQEYNRSLSNLGSKFIVGGDFNAKHAGWRSRWF